MQRESMGAAMVLRVGWRKTYQSSVFMACWWITGDSLGRPPRNVAEYSTWWGQSESKSYRELAVFRAATGYDNPTDLRVALEAAGVKLKPWPKPQVDRAVVDVLGLPFVPLVAA